MCQGLCEHARGGPSLGVMGWQHQPGVRDWGGETLRHLLHHGAGRDCEQAHPHTKGVLSATLLQKRCHWSDFNIF